MNSHRTEGALDAFERRTAWPMMAVVLASLALLLLPVFVTLPAAAAATVVALEWALWLVFLAEFSWRWYIAMDRAAFVKHNLIDLAVVVLPVVPALRALRLIRLLRIAVVGARVVDQSDAIVKRSNVKYAMMIAGLIILLAAALEWSAEHTRPEATIHSLPDALWWAVSTITTVGYGDKYPVTVEGKVVALTLMLVGIAIFGLVTATLASLFVERDAEEEADSIRADITRLENKIDRLLESLELAAVTQGDSEAAAPTPKSPNSNP
jgi:voltage-gated potassium channel